MEIQIFNKERFKHVKVFNERLDILFADKLKNTLSVLVKTSGNKNIVLDIEKCSFCDASGLSAMISANRLCEQEMGKFVVTGIHSDIEKLIKICLLDSVFPIAKNIDEVNNFLFANAEMN